MIDHTYRCIFIHQRKVAGSSVSVAFGYANLDDKGGSFGAYNNGTEAMDWHKRPKDYFVFSAVRNPFDRLISGWKNLSEVQHLTLEQLCENWPTEFRLHNHITRPQIKILRDKDGIFVPHDMLRYETLQSDFDRICDTIGKPRFELPRVNASERDRDYRKYFTPYTRRLTEEHFAEDLETFGYEF